MSTGKACPAYKNVPFWIVAVIYTLSIIAVLSVKPPANASGSTTEDKDLKAKFRKQQMISLASLIIVGGMTMGGVVYASTKCRPGWAWGALVIAIFVGPYVTNIIYRVSKTSTTVEQKVGNP